MKVILSQKRNKKTNKIYQVIKMKKTKMNKAKKLIIMWKIILNIGKINVKNLKFNQKKNIHLINKLKNIQKKIYF